MKPTHSVRHDGSVDDVRAMLLDPASRETAPRAHSVTSADRRTKHGVGVAWLGGDR